MNKSEIILNVLHKEFYKQWEQIASDYTTGVYLLKKYDNKDNLTPILRLIGIDDDAILYIGKSVDLGKRLGILVNLINSSSKTGKHSMGRRFQKYEILRTHLIPENLKLHIFKSEEPRVLESKLLEDYINRFGELPPLNNSR